MKKRKTCGGDDVIGDVTWFTRISGCNSPRVVFSCVVSKVEDVGDWLTDCNAFVTV
ncbi:hypothetical protein Hanom_Chr01g00069091 [Helianthus anomalus]